MSEQGDTAVQQHGTGAPDRVLAALQQGATLLTPNVRAARFWAGRFDAIARTAGESWRAATVLPWRAWTSRCWQDAVIHGADERVLLNDVQEHALWRQVIANHSADTLQSDRAQATVCQSASRLLGSYDVAARFAKGDYRQDSRSTDSQIFTGWYQAFEELCAGNGYLPSSHLEIELASFIRAGSVAHGGEYLLCGFHTLTAAQQHLLAALRATGAGVSQINPKVPQEAAPIFWECDSPREELQACAHWVRQQLEQESTRSVTVVVPDLESVRPELERELRCEVAPWLADVTCHGTAAPYEFSSGRVLRRLPMVLDALRLLRWCAGSLPLNEAGAVLRSRHLSLADSPEAGARLELTVLRELPLLPRTLSLQRAATALHHHAAGGRLATVETQARACRGAKNTFAWFADSARELLAAAGFPGKEALDSEEYQAVDRWNELLDSLSSLDLLGGKTEFDAFLAEVELLAEETIFAPENQGAPVQVISVYDAAGSTADALWFLHASAATWPGRAMPHPLLPWRLQRDLLMPGTDYARDEQAARAALECLLQSSAKVHFSYSCTAAESAQEPSPLVVQLTDQNAGAKRKASPASNFEEEPSLLVTDADEERLPALADSYVFGGVGVLKTQAQCGFRAFAEKRLFTAPLEQLETGLSPLDRGNQVHKVLELFWTEVQNQRALRDMAKHYDEEGVSARDRLLRRCIAQVVNPPADEAWDAAYLRVQRLRLFRLLSSWLDLEAARPAFEVLFMEKKIRDVPVGPLRLTMRVDRVDRVFSTEGDGTILIDYKTGSASPRDWLGERLDEPQLPAYAVAGAVRAGLDQVDGIAFGVVKVGDKAMELTGAARDVAILKQKGRKPIDFADQLAVWRADLDRLATAFAEGDAAVDPKEYPKTCKGCGQRMLCRIASATPLLLDDELEEDEAAAWS